MIALYYENQIVSYLLIFSDMSHYIYSTKGKIHPKTVHKSYILPERQVKYED